MDMLDLSIVSLAIFGSDLARYLFGAGSVWLLLWVVFEKPLRPRRVQADFPARTQLRREIGYSMLTVLVFAANGMVLWLMRQAGWTQIYDDIAAFGWGYWCASLAGIVLAHDAYFYWTHRLLHTPLLFRLVHRVHHLSRNPSPWAAYSFHPVEALVQAVFLPLFVLLIPLHGSAVGLFLLHMILRNAVGHSGTEIFPLEAARGGWSYWSTTVTHHHLHHARNRGNYALYFAWWDRLCGTQDPEYRSAWTGARGGGAAARATPAALAVVLALGALPGDALAGEAVGEWWTPGFNARVRIELCDDALCGTIVWVWDERPVGIADSGNLSGRRILRGMRSAGAGRWHGGRIYNPEDGREYTGSIVLKGERNLVVDGCVLMFCRSQVWRRYEPGECREWPARGGQTALFDKAD